MSDHQEPKSIDLLNTKRTQLREALIRIQTNAEAAQTELKRLQEEALKEYGTFDPSALEKLLDQWHRENTQALLNYESALNEVTQELKEAQAVIQSPD